VTDTDVIDARLIAAASRGDRESFARVYDRHAGTLLAVALRIVRERREAEDLVHDVFLEAWRVAKEYDPGRGTVRAWLTMRIRSRALDRLKSAGFSKRGTLDEARVASTAGADDAGLSADRDKVRRALAQLPDEQRQALELGFFEGLSSTEIAERMNVPVGTVKSRVAAALAKLRAAIGGAP
jgi:RNA polymerase sigma-70 factor (ECF subfamily)